MQMNMPLDGTASASTACSTSIARPCSSSQPGQTCHAYCSFCFRWAQFVGDKELRIASSEARVLHDYLRTHTEVTDLLVTGGDPMVMKTRHLREYLEPLLRPEFDHIQTIRIGSKALTFWPHRFLGAEGMPTISCACSGSSSKPASTSR